MAESYRDNRAWQKSVEVVTTVYRVTEDFPPRETYGLARQMREAAVSVPSNIAEGKGRQTKKDYLQFLYRARGSSLELQTQLQIPRNLSLLDATTFACVDGQAAEAGRILNGLIADMSRQIERAPKS